MTHEAQSHNRRAIRPASGATKHPIWLYIIGGVALLCFLLGFTPGGEAMWTLDIWILSWPVTILVLKHFGIKGFLKAVLGGLVTFLLLGIFLA